MKYSRGRQAGLLIALMVFFVVSTAGIARGDYNVSVSSSLVSVNITTVFIENLTDVQLPTYSLVLSGANASTAAQAISSALNTLVPGTSASALILASSSSANSTNLKVSFNVLGATTSSNGQSKIVMGWKSFDLRSDITSGTISLNLVGRYLLNSSILNRVSSPVNQWSYLEDGAGTSARGSVVAASSFNLLDFSRLSLPLQNWPQRMNVSLGGATILTNAENHNLTITETIREPEGPVSTRFVAGYSHHVQITTTGPATIRGDNVFIDSNNSNILTMVVIILSAPLAGLSAFVLERRVNKSGRYGTQKTRRTRKK